MLVIIMEIHMLKILTAILAATVSSAAVELDATPQTRLDADLRCHLGVYELQEGRTITINGVNGQQRAFQYTQSDGRFGTLQEKAASTYTSGAISIVFSPCSVGTLQLIDGRSTMAGAKLRLVEQETTFISDGIRLHGKLVLPPNGQARAIAVWIEGSNNNPSTDDAVWPFELARRGIGILVYDKRGTGGSAGETTSDFYARARDTAAAVKAARLLAPNTKCIGVIGASQGGWVAPLAATLTQLDFIVTAFAMAEGPIAQDQTLVEQQVLGAGFGQSELDEARMLTKITAQIVRTNLSAGKSVEKGLADLEAFKASHDGAPWMKAIQARSYTGLFLRFSAEDIRTHGPKMAQGLTFDFEPRMFIERILVRQLWLLGGKDTQAPNIGTQAVLRQLQKQRQDIAVVVFPPADHGLIETITTVDGPKMVLSDRQFDIAADWIKDGSLPGAGNFIVLKKIN
jgi:uncharacterized protein